MIRDGALRINRWEFETENKRWIFVDIHENRKHAAYDPVSDTVFEVSSLSELISGGYNVIVTDLPSNNIWDEIYEPVSDNCRVLYFSRPWLWKQYRRRFADILKERFRREKSDFGDAFLLALIYEDAVVHNNAHKLFRRL